MKLIKILCTALCFFFLNTEGMSTPHEEVIDPSSRKIMPFKVGFEFQESSGLCPAEIRNHSIQKKPLFEAQYDAKPLWHIEIDGNDIEFVTVPFSHEEKERLTLCMKSIQIATNTLDLFRNVINCSPSCK